MTRTAHRIIPKITIAVLIAAYIITFSTLAIRQHEAFLTNTRDLGNMDQPAWNTLHGRFVARTLDGAPSSRLTDHVEPIFVLVSLVFLIWDDVRALFVLQTALIAIGAIPVYQIARARFSKSDKVSELTALAFVLAYLLFPALQAATLTEFHATPLAVPFLLWAFYYAKRRAYARFWLCFTLALSCQEEVALVLFMLGLYMIYRARFDRRNRHAQHGAVAMLISAAWFVLAAFIIIPAHSPLGMPHHLSRYAHLNSPRAVIDAVFALPKIKYVGGLLLSTGGLAVLNIPTLLPAAPVLTLNVLSNYEAMYSGAYHYSALVVPFITIASIYGGAWLVSQRRVGQLSIAAAHDSTKSRYVLAAWVVLSALGYQFAQGYSPLGRNFYWAEVTAHHRTLARFAAQIPSDAILSTQPSLNPHFTHRETIYDFPLVKDAEYILLDVAAPTQMSPYDFHRAYHETIASGEFEILDSADGYILLQRAENSDNLELPDAFYDFARVTAPAPRHPLLVDFGDKVRLLGYDVEQDLWHRVYLRLYWQALRDMSNDYRLYPFYYDDAGQIIEDTTARPMVAPIWYPTSAWRAGEIIVTETLPWELPARFHIGVGVVARHDWHKTEKRLPIAVIPTARVRVAISPDGTWAHLATCVREGKKRVRVHEQERLYAAPRLQHEQRAYFADKVALLGYNLTPAKPRRGQDLSVQLYWQAVTEMRADYTVFVHLVDEDSALITQHDAPPALPTSSWWGAEVVPDTHRLHIPANIAAGAYYLRVGLYHPQTLARPPLHNAVDDYVTLKPLRVE